MLHPQPHPNDRPVRILFVLETLDGGTAEIQARRLAGALDPARFRIDMVVCLRRDGVPDRSHQRLTSAGITVDLEPYELSLEDTVAYLERKMTGYEVVVSCQDVADIYPALEGMHLRPPLIEYGTRRAEALGGPRHLTARYVAASSAVRDAAVGLMQERPGHAVFIPPMVDVAPMDAGRKAALRARLGLPEDALVVGWVASPDSRIDDFLAAAAAVAARYPDARLAILGGTDSLAERAAYRARAATSGLGARLSFLRERDDLPDVMAALDVLVCISAQEGSPHLIAEAGAAHLAVIAGADWPDGIRHDQNGLTVPTADPDDLASAIERLLADAGLRQRLAQELHRETERSQDVTLVVPQWQTLFSEVTRNRAAPPARLFRSFLQGGFECSTQRLRQGRRLDVLAATGHDTHAEADYRQLGTLGMKTFRDAARWHLIEQTPNRHDFSSWRPMLRAARKCGVQVIWDLLHYGYPDDIDIWSPAFVDRFARFARAAAQAFADETDDIPFWCPVNEISFFSWAGGDVRYLNPFAAGRGFELKVQLARASIMAMHALREVDPRARFVHCEPAIAIHHDPATGRPRAEQQGFHEAQYQAHELLSGRMWPQIGGDPSFLDIIGLNYYFNNQWVHGGPPIDVDHRLYRPLSDILFESHARYGRPVMIAETGIEGARRASWFRYVAAEVERARARGVPVEGICLYPVVSHLGWDDDRSCHNGLLSLDRVGGLRQVEFDMERVPALDVAPV